MIMAYNEMKRNIIGTLCFFALGLLIGGFASMIAVIREWVQYKANGVLEQGDLWRYVFASSIGAVIQMIVLLYIIFR
jgi:hypothetical protein